MKWPWVARSTLDAVVEERDRLRAQVDQLMDHLKRVERAREGLRETPPEARKVEPMPDEVIRLITRWESEGTQRKLEEDARRAYARFGNWKAVERFLGGDE